MPKVNVTGEAPAPPDKVWELLTDLPRWPEWFSTHDAFLGDLPATLTEGAKFRQRVKAMGMPAETAWTVTTARAPELLELAGDGPMGVKVRSADRVEPSGSGSRITMDTEFEGGMLAGPMGAMVAKQAGESGEKSLAKFAALLA